MGIEKSPKKNEANMDGKKNSIYRKFNEEERITVKLEGGKELLILLTANIVRTFKIEFYLDNKLIKPKRYGGRIKAYEAWQNLSKMLKNEILLIEYKTN